MPRTDHEKTGDVASPVRGVRSVEAAALRPSSPNLPASSPSLLPKVEDEITRADLKKAAAMPARSLLFNIDQKFDGIGGNHEAPILEVFMKVLNELQGYYGARAMWPSSSTTSISATSYRTSNRLMHR